MLKFHYETDDKRKLQIVYYMSIELKNSLKWYSYGINYGKVLNTVTVKLQAFKS
jgi:hypothetical protein